jgi:hypothetical protein
MIFLLWRHADRDRHHNTVCDNAVTQQSLSTAFGLLRLAGLIVVILTRR